MVRSDERGGVGLSLQIMDARAEPYAFSVCLEGPPEVVQAPFRDGCFDPFTAGAVNDMAMMKMIQIPQVFLSMEYGDWRWPGQVC